MSVQMQYVQSSNLEAVGYSRKTERLYIQFKSGAEWVYNGVSFTVYQNLMSAPSKGKYFYYNIRDIYAAWEGSPDTDDELFI